jgi:hypothetical protein
MLLGYAVPYGWDFFESSGKAVRKGIRNVFLKRLKKSVKKQKCTGIIPNIVVEWTTLLLHIREVPSSNLCPKSAYPD